MAKIDKFQQARMDGMVRALYIAKTGGIDALEDEVKFRNAVPVPFELDKKYAGQVLDGCAERIYSTFTTVVYKALHEEFGFGAKRLQAVESKIQHDCEEIDSVDPYGYRYLEFTDIAKEYNKLYGLHINTDATKKSDDLTSRSKDLRMSVRAVHEWLVQNGFDDAAVKFREWFPEALGGR